MDTAATTTRAEAPTQPADPRAVLEFMYRLGQAYLACGEQTAKVELILRRVATSLGMRRTRVVAFPTAIFITLHDGTEERITLAEGPTESLRLDQIAEVYDLGDAAQDGKLPPRQGLEQLSTILKRRPRFGQAGVVVGHTILTIGLAMILNASLTYLGAAALLGALVGALKVLNRGRAVLSVPMPVIVAGLVAAIVYFAVRRGVAINPLHTLIPPLVTFLPGAMLTMGMVELAYGDMVSGSSRLIAGFVQLVLLTFGLAAGAAIAGVQTGVLLESTAQYAQFGWISWVGVLIFGVGVYLHFSAPRNSLLWMLLVLLLTFLAQRIAAHFVGRELSGFFGTLVATPVGYLIEMRFKGPPAMVTFLPSFWLLVPGSLGLLSVTRMLGDKDAGIAGLSSAIFAFTSIALGTLMGASLYRWLSERFGSWRLQAGRARSYFRRSRKSEK